MSASGTCGSPPGSSTVRIAAHCTSPGVFDSNSDWTNVGITTNPTILERDGVPCNIEALTSLAKTVRRPRADTPDAVPVSSCCNAQALKCGAEEIHVQAWGDTPDKLHSVALDLAGINPKRVVVPPATPQVTRSVPVELSWVPAGETSVHNRGHSSGCHPAHQQHSDNHHRYPGQPGNSRTLSAVCARTHIVLTIRSEDRSCLGKSARLLHCEHDNRGAALVYKSQWVPLPMVLGESCVCSTG
jgi:hypothetical protein